MNEDVFPIKNWEIPNFPGWKPNQPGALFSLLKTSFLRKKKTKVFSSKQLAQGKGCIIGRAVGTMPANRRNLSHGNQGPRTMKPGILITSYNWVVQVPTSTILGINILLVKRDPHYFSSSSLCNWLGSISSPIYRKNNHRFLFIAHLSPIE